MILRLTPLEVELLKNALTSHVTALEEWKDEAIERVDNEIVYSELVQADINPKADAIRRTFNEQMGLLNIVNEKLHGHETED